MNWKLMSGICAFIAFLVAIMMKKMTSIKGFSPEVTAMWYAGLLSAYMFVACVCTKQSWIPAKGMLPWIVVFSLAQFILISFLWRAMKTTPNPGYVIAIITLATFFILISAKIFLKSELDFKATLGSFMVLGGTILVALS